MKTVAGIILSALVAMIAVDDAFAQENKELAGIGLENPGLHARLFESYMERLTEDCFDRGTADECFKKFWGFADISGDSNLSVAEITRILRILAGGIAWQEYEKAHSSFWSEVDSNRAGEPPENEEIVAVLAAGTVGPVFSHGLIANFDYNYDGLLSEGEVRHDVEIDITMSSVESLQGEIQSRALRATEILMKILANE